MSQLPEGPWAPRVTPHRSKTSEEAKEAPPGESSFQKQIGQLVSETDLLNLYVVFCYFKCRNRSKCSSLTLGSLSFSKRLRS